MRVADHEERSVKPTFMRRSVITRNILSRLGAKCAGYVLGFAASILLVRYLGVERLGQYNYVSTFASLFGLLAGLGLPILLTREAARDKSSAGASLGAALVLQYGLAALTFLTVAASGALFNPRELVLPITLLGAGVAVSALGAPYLALLNAFEKMHVASAIEVISTLLRVGLILVAIQLRVDVTGLVALLLATPLVVFVLTKLASDRFCVPPDYTFEGARLKALLTSTIPFALMVIFNNVYYRVDVVMLEKMKGDAAVGIYSAAYKLLDVLMVVGANITGVLYPRMAAQATAAPRALQQTIERSYRYMTAVGIPASVVITLLAPWIVRVLFGSDFSDSAPVLRILVLAIPPMFMYMPLAHALNATGREWYWIMVLSANTLINIGLNLVLIPTYSFMGAAISTVFCELMGLILVALLARRMSDVRYLSALVPVLASSVLLGLPVWYFSDTHRFTGLTLGALGYCATLYLVGFFTPEEKLALRQLFALGSAR